MLDAGRIEEILSCLPKLTIGVLGDLFLDRYLDIDARLTEPGATPPRLGIRGTAQLIGENVPLYLYLFRKPISFLRQKFGL